MKVIHVIKGQLKTTKIGAVLVHRGRVQMGNPFYPYVLIGLCMAKWLSHC